MAKRLDGDRRFCSQRTWPPWHWVGFLAVSWLLASITGDGAAAETPAADAAAPGKAALESAEGTDFDGEQVVAEVGSRRLTLGELMFRFASLPPEVRGRYGSRLDVFLDDVVSNLLVVAEAERLRVDEDPLFATLMQLQREQVLRDLYARRTVLSQVDEATVERRYGEEAATRFERRPRVRVRHILVTPVDEPASFHRDGEDAVGEAAARLKMKSLQRQLASTAVSFEELARQASEDASAPEGGDLGWLDPSELSPPLAKATMDLPLGEVSEVIVSPLGLHLLRVDDRRPAGRIPLDVVYELLYQEIVGERLQFLGPTAQQDRQRLLDGGDVRVFPERLPW